LKGADHQHLFSFIPLKAPSRLHPPQEFSLLFFFHLSKANKKTGKAPLYYRLKIDGASLDRL
jgi:hypothetical protein